ncbi:GFA family protein [Flexibacterium corallicola]|uniref:GFA family protein n=1 Tax=Flexibacterium corallicola TaxID=3037259 RepID=UPI00286FA7A0|nr:GFA family protein [Pseudovibrio sp. M1P-2-3]
MQLTGKCLCGTVKFTCDTDNQTVSRCHCGQCRNSGGAFDSVGTKFAKLEFLEGEDQLTWYESSDYARRGFCPRCGSTLFWHADRHPEFAKYIAISVGSLNDTSGLKLAKHIFCADKGGYYEIDGDVLQLETY